ncbi:C13 family peptidase [Luteibacter aegosomatissinici]|uniref:C13 family peptidase n=1 Tax=Luteibacter aegosomatissinici TaxID=2911539 RepID=UPI001FF70BA7|nr:C13 family peptidase [Luteibacter aegosomatissinici]UPG92488.1 C13 family peptidase [Luteibacter aegosomatissinici]
MPSSLDPRRRTAIYTLAGFIAGALLTAAILNFGPRPVVTGVAPVAPSPASTAALPSASATSARATVAVAASAPAPSSTAPDADAESDAGDDQGAQLDVDSWPQDAPSPEQVFAAQPGALQAALGRLAKRTPGKPNVYAVAFGADGSEDVFRNEAEYVDKLMTTRFGSPAHTLVLENNPATLSSHPLASWTNLEGAVDGLAKVMNPKEDILLVYIATHGGSDHSLLVDMDPIPLDQLDPDGLAQILAKHDFRWKVVVVNACYSGGYLPKLRGNGTLVLASARTDRTSFGCGTDSDITYFGHAWLENGLNATPDFVDAFNKAKVDIADWEKRDAVTPSEPQIDIGTGIEDKLAAWRKVAKIGPAVPFAPAK